MGKKKEKENVKIMRAKYDGSNVVVELLNEKGETETIKSRRNPHEDFKKALKKLVPIMSYHMELDDMDTRITVTEVIRKDSQEYSGYLLKGSLYCPGSQSRMNISSCFLLVPDELFWTEHDINEKDYNGILDDEEIGDLENVLNEAYLYARKNKNGVEQPDLFDGEDEKEEENE